MEEKGGKSSDSEVKEKCDDESRGGTAARERSYEDTVVEVTCKASDAFIKKREADLRALGRRAIGSFSYRVGMAEMIFAFEQQVGKEATELALKALEKNLRRRRLRPDFEYVDVCGVDGCDDDVIEEGTDEYAPCSLAGDETMIELRLRRLMDMRKRLRKRDRDDPAFG